MEKLWCVTIEDLKKELKAKIETTEAKIEALKNITFNSKKDGKDFANLSKNFNNCYIDGISLKADFRIGYKWSYHWFYIDMEIKDPETAKNRVVADRDIYGKPRTYFMTVAEIKEKIKSEIKRLTDKKNELLDLYNNIENIKLIQLLLEAQKEFRSLENVRNELYYLVFNYFYG